MMKQISEKSQITPVDDGLLVRAPAKINLTLLIAGKRPDGFHNIETVMAKVNYYDEIIVQKSSSPGITFINNGPCWSPDGKENLIYKTAQILLDYADIKSDIKITLNKNIPAGTGLGSASSDAAATLIGLDQLLDLNLTHLQLAKIAETLGSDVPFFLGHGLAFCSGKGEIIKKIDKIFDFLALLILPDVNSSTKRVYESYRHDEALYKTLSEKINPLIKKNNVDLASQMCANMLESTCLNLYSDIDETKKKLEALGVRPLCLSGSGSALFCLIENMDEKKATHMKKIVDKNTSYNNLIVYNNSW
jgi:4-diphosphocytidyl-2-C-methyl-D-erythritol kinase